MNNGWISLHRQLMEWEWYNDSRIVHTFIHCLFKANHKARKWQGTQIERGQFITSVENMSIDIGCSIQQMRTILNKLKSTNEITIKTSNKFSIISITNYDKFQDTNKQDNNQITNNQQTSNNQITNNQQQTIIKTTKEFNNDNKEGYKNIAGLNQNAFEKYLSYRKEAGIKKLTKQGEILAAKKLVKFGSQLEVVDQSIANGWSGLFALKKEKITQKKQSRIDEFNKWIDEDDEYIDGECNVVS